jgi:hypothetical protein
MCHFSTYNEPKQKKKDFFLTTNEPRTPFCMWRNDTSGPDVCMWRNDISRPDVYGGMTYPDQVHVEE